MNPAKSPREVTLTKPFVNPQGPQRVPSPLLARLLIHAGDAADADVSHLESALRRLRSLSAGNRSRRAGPALQVQIDDIQGRCLFVSNAVGPLTDLPLPAGTCQVTAQWGKICRSYTLTLEPGRSIDLYLRLASPSGT